MIPQYWGGRDINRGLAVACLILTRQTVGASSDEQEKDRFVTREFRGGFRAFFATSARNLFDSRDSIGVANVQENMGESRGHWGRSSLRSLPTLAARETFGVRRATHSRLGGESSRKARAL